MSHEITKEDNVMLAKTAWHRLGNVVGRAFSWADAVAANIPVTYGVTKVPLGDILTPFPAVDGGPTLRAANDQFANVRDDGLILYSGGGIQHTVFHAHDGYSLGQAIREDEEGEINANLLSLGTLRQGRVWFLTYDLGDFEIVGYPVKDYMTLSGSYDSTRKFKLVDGPTLVVCANTLAASDFGMRHFEFRHTTGIFDRVAAAKQAIKTHRENRLALTATAEKLDSVPLPVAAYRRLLASLFPTDDVATVTQNRNRKAMGIVHDLFRGAPVSTGEAAVNDGRRTGFALVQAVNTYEQWHAPVKAVKGETKEDTVSRHQLDSVLDGKQPLTSKAVEYVLALA